MKVIVTGGAGFIGRHVVDRFKDTGYDVQIWDNLSIGRYIKDDDEFHQLDVAYFDIDRAAKRVGDEEVIIIHLAAQPRIQPSIVDTSTTHKSNVDGTYRMLEFARKVNTKMFIYAGSSSVYGGGINNLESDDIHIKSPYSLSKYIGELYCRLYSSLYGIPSVVLRFFNVYGPGQIEDGDYATVIGIFEKCYRENKPFPIVGSGLQRRDFTHIDDIADGIYMAATLEHSLVMGEVVNLGKGENYSILEIANMFGGETEFIPQRPGEYECTMANHDRAKRFFGWYPQHNLIEYIEKIKINKGGSNGRK